MEIPRNDFVNKFRRSGILQNKVITSFGAWGFRGMNGNNFWWPRIPLNQFLTIFSARDSSKWISNNFQCWGNPGRTWLAAGDSLNIFQRSGISRQKFATISGAQGFPEANVWCPLIPQMNFRCSGIPQNKFVAILGAREFPEIILNKFTVLEDSPE